MPDEIPDEHKMPFIQNQARVWKYIWEMIARPNVVSAFGLALEIRIMRSLVLLQDCQLRLRSLPS